MVGPLQRPNWMRPKRRCDRKACSRRCRNSEAVLLLDAQTLRASAWELDLRGRGTCNLMRDGDVRDVIGRSSSRTRNGPKLISSNLFSRDGRRYSREMSWQYKARKSRIVQKICRARFLRKGDDLPLRSTSSPISGTGIGALATSERLGETERRILRLSMMFIF